MKGDFYLDAWLVQPSLGRMSLAGRTVQVRPKVMDLLVYLAGSPGMVISKETLLNEVWHTDAVSESALTRTITELRNAVADDVDQPRFLETIPKRGYRLIAPVRPFTSTEQSSPPSGRRRARAIWTVAGLSVVLVLMLLAAGIWVGNDRFASSGSAVSELRLSDGNRASPNHDANSYYERALLFGGGGTLNPGQAVRMIERALALDPKFAAARAEYAFFHVARILIGESNDASLFYKAESEARQALRDDPRCGRAHSVLALIYLLQGRKELVVAEVDQALKENPADVTAHTWLLHYHRFNGDYDRAGEQAAWLIRHWPVGWAGHFNLGELLREQGDLGGAIREQERVLEQDSQNLRALGALTRAYIEAADLSKARQTLNRARGEDRQNYWLRLQRALLLALEGKKSEAAQEMDDGLQTYAGVQIFGPAIAADFYAVMDDANKALEWSDRAVRMGDDREAYLRRNSLLKHLRAHPRFQQILDAVAYRRHQRAVR
jgi:DNA-binding winged helix-turn-helix (wHTH) protein/Tfp pilus assembly protein PilF